MWSRFSQKTKCQTSKQGKTHLFKNIKSTLKMQVSKAISSITRFFASRDIHYNNCLNTENSEIK